jgi:putative membrane protein
MTSLSSGKSLNKSMNNALKHYSSLFFLPPFKKTLGLAATLCIGVVGLSTFLLFRSLDWLAPSILLGASLFVVNLLFDYLLSNLVLKSDPVFITRRTLGLSLFCWVLWLPFILLGVVFGATLYLWLWIKFCVLGFCVVLTFRAVVFFSVSSAGQLRASVASLLQPFGCLVVFMVFWSVVNNLFLTQLLLFVIVTPLLCLASSLLFVSLIDRQGRQTHGVPSMSLFKAFILNWVEGLNEPLEFFLEKLGEDTDIEISLIKFDASKPKAAIIVPLVHPGPFKNIGSSNLPFLLKRDFERAFHCSACVPLGILGHELDLASQKQNLKVIESVIASATLKASIDKATPFVRNTNGSATVSCQIFGKTSILSFTLAPETTEDLPQELGGVVRKEAEKRGLDCCVVINAHNSITESMEIGENFDALRSLAIKCLDEAVASDPERFEVGAATVYPKEYGLKEGMGAGGITAVIVKVAEQKTAYIVIDGNNMISGLRERVLFELAAAGFDESEVFTTDTHAVSAVVLGRRGYHPVGEAMDHEKLIGYVREAAIQAASELEECMAACKNLVTPKIRVIGADRIQSLTALVDMAIKRAKQIILPVFGLEGVLLVLFLAFL